MIPETEEEEQTAQTKSQSNAKKQQVMAKEEEKKEKIAQKQRQSNAKKQQAMTEEEEKKEKIAQKQRQSNAKKQQAMTEEENQEKQIIQKKEQCSCNSQQTSEEKQPVQMKSAKPSQGKKTATADLEASVQKERGRGQPINDNVRGQLERGFGADFSGVRIHTDGKSDQLNQSIQARAFTTGQDIFFRQGAYDPSSKQGQQLLAHELTHVVQQSGGAVQAKSDVNLTAKDNKVQTKTTLAPSSTPLPAIQHQETPDQKTEPEQQPEPTQPDRKADAGAGEGQPQPPADNNTAVNQPSSVVGGAAAVASSSIVGANFGEGIAGGQQGTFVPQEAASISNDETDGCDSS
jgi:hypothetical protein